MTGKLDLETRLIAALADTARRNLPDSTVAPPLRRPAVASEAHGRFRSWLVPALVAAVVVTLAVGAFVLTNGGQQHHRPPSAAPNHAVVTFVTLRARGPLSVAELDRARQVIIARAVALGAEGGEVQVVGSDEITAFLPGLTTANAAGLGAVDALEFRPLIVDPISTPAPKKTGTTAPGSAARVVDPWRSLGFAPPTDAAAFIALSAGQQQAVRAVLRGWNCLNAPLDRADAPILACDQSRTMKYLLGAAIFPAGEVRSAVASAPGGPQFSWQVIVSLSAGGQQRWTDYTAKHNESEHPGEVANEVATTLDGVVVVASTIQATINGDTSITGNFTRLSATTLAANLTGGTLPVPFDVVSVQAK